MKLEKLVGERFRERPADQPEVKASADALYEELQGMGVEIVSRDKSLRMESSLDGAVTAIQETINSMLKNQ